MDLEAFYTITSTLEIDPADLMRASIFPDQIIGKAKKECWKLSRETVGVFQ